MKKLLCLLLALCMCLSLSMLFTACDEEPTDPNADDTAPQEGQVLLNGVPLADYVIVYPSGDDHMKEAADYLVTAIKDRYSCVLQRSSDALSASDAGSATGYEILLGNTNRDTSAVQGVTLTKDDYMIAPVGKSVWLTSSSLTLLYKAIDDFEASFVSDGKNTCMELSAPKKVSDTSYLRIMSYNVLGGTNHASRDFERINMLLDLIEKYEPDIFGVQEATPNWMSSLRERFGDRYDSVGVGRYADGSGEACAIFYLKDRFEILDNDTGTRWLSNTPDVPGSRLENSEYTRIYTYAKFKDKKTGKVFLHANTHLDLDDLACEEQANILIEELKPYKEAGIPLIATGDYNCRKGSFAYITMTDARWGGLSDSLDVADYTLNGSDSMIDHIFLSKEVDVAYYQVCTETYARANGEIVQPSDHRPVFIDCVIP